MNRRYSPIDARIRDVTRSLVGIGTHMRVALQHGPEEDSGRSS